MGIKLILLMSIVLGGIALQNAVAESGFEEDGSADASKRGVISFGLMVYRRTGRNPLDFNGYGCWCGLGGEGTPVDKLDRCCKVHDKCYHKLKKSKVCPFKRGVYILPYATKKGKPTKCKPAKYYWFWGECRHRLCKCDAAAAECFAKSTYHRKYKKYPQKKCKKGRPAKPEKPEKTEKPDKAEKPEKPEKPEEPEKPENPEKPEEPEKQEKPDKPREEDPTVRIVY